MQLGAISLKCSNAGPRPNLEQMLFRVRVGTEHLHEIAVLLELAIALATFVVMWPSQSTKKKYSHALRLLGRDSILVMFSLYRRNGASAGGARRLRARC